MKVIVRPHSGLANRIRVMVSALALSEALNKQLIIVWERAPWLNCEYNDLFMKNDKLNIVPGNWKLGLLNIFKKYGISQKILLRLFKFSKVIYDEDHKQLFNTEENTIRTIEWLKNLNGTIYIKGCEEFLFQREYLQYFLPSAPIREQIELNTKRFNQHTIGIHIRRTDHDLSIETSPLHLFKMQMHTEIESNPEVTFYLATDDREVKNELIDEFGLRIIYYNGILNRTSKEGMIGGIVDLFSLSNASKIYGSFWSAYSEMASKIGNIPLIVLQKSN